MQPKSVILQPNFESRERMADICFLGMLTSDVTLPCIACCR